MFANGARLTSLNADFILQLRDCLATPFLCKREEETQLAQEKEKTESEGGGREE